MRAGGRGGRWPSQLRLAGPAQLDRGILDAQPRTSPQPKASRRAESAITGP